MDKEGRDAQQEEADAFLLDYEAEVSDMDVEDFEGIEGEDDDMLSIFSSFDNLNDKDKDEEDEDFSDDMDEDFDFSADQNFDDNF